MLNEQQAVSCMVCPFAKARGLSSHIHRRTINEVALNMPKGWTREIFPEKVANQVNKQVCV